FLLPHPLPSVLYTLSLHDALPILAGELLVLARVDVGRVRVEPLQAAVDHVLDELALALAVQLDDVLLLDLVEDVDDQGDVLVVRSEEHTSELQSPYDLVCRLLLEK